jgi:hypothetical protein
MFSFLILVINIMFIHTVNNNKKNSNKLYIYSRYTFIEDDGYILLSNVYNHIYNFTSLTNTYP